MPSASSPRCPPYVKNPNAAHDFVCMFTACESLVLGGVTFTAYDLGGHERGNTIFISVSLWNPDDSLAERYCVRKIINRLDQSFRKTGKPAENCVWVQASRSRPLALLKVDAGGVITPGKQF